MNEHVQLASTVLSLFQRCSPFNCIVSSQIHGIMVERDARELKIYTFTTEEMDSSLKIPFDCSGPQRRLNTQQSLFASLHELKLQCDTDRRSSRRVSEHEHLN